jgi:hypothetical protein
LQAGIAAVYFLHYSRQSDLFGRAVYSVISKISISFTWNCSEPVVRLRAGIAVAQLRSSLVPTIVS